MFNTLEALMLSQKNNSKQTNSFQLVIRFWFFSRKNVVSSSFVSFILLSFVNSSDELINFLRKEKKSPNCLKQSSFLPLEIDLHCHLQTFGHQVIKNKGPLVWNHIWRVITATVHYGQKFQILSQNYETANFCLLNQ